MNLRQYITLSYRYQRLLQQPENAERESAVLEAQDVLWRRMTDSERTAANRWSRWVPKVTAYDEVLADLNEWMPREGGAAAGAP